MLLRQIGATRAPAIQTDDPQQPHSAAPFVLDTFYTGPKCNLESSRPSQNIL